MKYGDRFFVLDRSKSLFEILQEHAYLHDLGSGYVASYQLYPMSNMYVKAVRKEDIRNGD